MNMRTQNAEHAVCAPKGLARGWFRSVLDLRPQRPGSIHAPSQAASVAVDCAEATRWSSPVAAI